MRKTKPRIATAAGVALLAAHFGITALHVTPVNPLKVEHERLVSAWIGPVFEQNWKLFAPDPIAIDQGLLVRTRDAAGNESEFVDLSTPFLEDKHHNLLPTREGYQVSGVITRFIDARQVILDAQGLDTTTAVFLGPEDLAAASEADRSTYTEALGDLRDTARHHGADGDDATHVQLRLVQHTFPRYSDRANTGLGEITHATSPWLDAEGDLA